MNNLKKRCLTLLLSLAMIITYMPLSMITAYAAEGDGVTSTAMPEPKKLQSDNQDGTYSLSLDITGSADTTSTDAKANVLLVYDTSGSMLMHFPNETGSWGHSGNYASQGWFQLYKRTGNRYVALTDDEEYKGTVYRRYSYGLYDDYEEYRGDRYSSDTRAQNAEKTAYDFADALFKYNNSSNPDNVQMALVTFDTGSEETQGWTNSSTRFLNLFSNDGVSTKRDYGGVTNWESALRRALTTLGNADDDPTFVVFITDGAPNRNAKGDDRTNYQAYTDALDESLHIEQYNTKTSSYTDPENSNTELYGIYAFGNEADYLDDLIYYAHNARQRSDVSERTVDTPYYYNASDSDGLNAAINAIFADIVDTLGVGSVTIADGTTSNVSAGSQVADLLEVVDDSYEYWMELPVTGNGPYTMTRKDLVSGQDYDVTFTETSKGVYTATWTDSTGAHTVEGLKAEYNLGKLKYKWESKNDFYNFDPPAAELKSQTVDGVTSDTVVWDLNSVGTLLNGVKYSVTFDVYPSQYTYDTIAQLKNGDIQYDNLPKLVKDYLVKDGDNYSLKTNTSAQVTYTDTREENAQPTTKTYENPKPVATEAERFTINKEWEGGNAPDGELPLTVMMGDKEFHTAKLSGNTTPAWTTTSFVSVGIIKDNKPLSGAKGHDFSFAELGNAQYRWELHAPTVRPMLINGDKTPTLLVKEDKANGYDSTGKTTYTIDGSVYYVDEAVAALTATNHRRSNLNLKKVVTGEDADPDTLFPFTLTVNNSKAPEQAPADDDGHDSDYWVWFSIADYNDLDDEGNPKTVTEGITTNATANGNGYYYAPSGYKITVSMKAGWGLRFTNLPSGTTYEFTEGTADGFKLTSVENTGAEDKDFSGDVSGKKATGKIQTYDAKAYEATFTNDYQKADVEITKVWDDNNNQDGLRPKAGAFKSMLVLKADGTDVTSANADKLTVTVDSKDSNKYIAKWTGLDRYANDKEIKYTVEEKAIEGYTPEGSPAEDKGTIKNTHTPETKEFTGTKTWDDEKYSTGDAAEIGTANEYARPSSIKIVLTGSDGKTYNVVLDGKKDDEPTAAAPSGYESEAWAYKFVNLPKYANGEEITYTVTEEEVNEGDLDGYKDPTVSGGNVTNTPDEAEEVGEIDMTLNKTDANTGNPIDGAVFTLTGPSGEGSTSEDITVTEGSVNHTFTKPGTYTLKEKKAPAGYQADTKEYKIVVSKKLDSIKLKSSVWTWAYNLIFGEGTETTFDRETNTLTIPNTPTTTGVEATKVWDDNNNQDGKRDDVTFVLKADGKAVSGQDKVIKKDATGNALKVSWTGLDAYKDGAKIVYTVEEKGASGGKITMNGAEYSVKTEGDAEKGFKITNSYTPEKTTVTVNKTWVGDDEWKDTVRPDSITVNLEADGAAAVDTAGEAVPAATITPDKTGKWTYTFDNLPKYKDGKAIKYTVAEDAVAGYTTTYSEDTLTITNTYAPTPTTAEFKVKKNLVVPPGLDGPAAWSYDITAAANGTAPAPETATQTVTQAADTATFTFADDAFKKPGTYTYTITEAGEVDGVTNDPSEGKTVTVTVTGNKNGTLSAAVTPNTAGVAAAFNNTYGAKPVSVDPPVQKVIVGNDDLYNGGDFTFTIANKAKPATVETAPMPAKASIKNQASDELQDKKGFYEFGEITFTAPGIYKYEVTESGSVAGVTNDKDATKSFTFTVTDDGEGKLSVTPATDQAVFVFTNTYSASGSATLQATKAIEGREWKDNDSFTFELIGEDGKTIDTQTATKAKKTVTFKAIEYTLADASKTGKDHVYTIRETGILPAGMSKSGDITATVTVKDNGNGELETSTVYKVGDKVSDTITNTYSPESTNAVIEVNKNIKGYLKDDSGNADATFKFELLDNDGKKIDETSITTEDGKGKAEFKAIEYKEAGTYTYTVKETVETKAGFKYDVSTYTATVTVTDNTDKGKLEANVSYKKADADATDITFENEFKMTSVKVDLKLNKEIDDKSDSAHDSTFRFTLKDPDGKEVATKEIKTKDLKGSTVFEDIEFTKAGEYIYTVTEEDTGEAGFKYDTTEHTYKIIVKNNFDTAVVEVDEEGSTLEAKIINEYKAADTAIVLKATKDINDTSDSAYDTEFTFTLKDKDGKTIDTKSVTGKGEVSFEEIPYEKAGTYKYTIQETAGDAKGYTYDSKVYNVTVKVVDEEGKLVATAKYDTDESGEGKTDLTITNTYDPEDAKIALEANKLIEDKTGGATGKTFKFELLEDNKVIDTASRVGGGPVSFKEITYSKVGEHNYKIREVAGKDSGYTYDTNEYPVKVVVTDHDKDGVLKAAITEGDKVEITNIYEAEPVKAAVKAKKVLEGRALKSGEFKFQLMEDGKVVSEGTNAADGSIVFGEITYKKTGVYNYTVAEVAGSDTSVTYDKALYPITVTVTDDGEGMLKAAISGTPVFRNTFVEPPKEGSNRPKTGDTNDLTGMLGLMGTSAAGLMYMFFRRRREDSI